jgi:hypothetical protein
MRKEVCKKLLKKLCKKNAQGAAEAAAIRSSNIAFLPHMHQATTQLQKRSEDSQQANNT